jgi:O-Antigen ligase
MSLTSIPFWLFLGSLMIAPQLWWGPMLDWRVDFIVYPLWAILLAVRGRLQEVWRFQALDRYFILMYVWILLSSITNGWTDTSSTQWFLYTKYFVVYRFTCASISSFQDLRRAGYVFLALAMVLAIEGIQHTHNPDGTGWAGQSFAWIDGAASEIGIKSRIRWVGIFDGPGVFCVVFTTALPFAFRYIAPPVALPLRLLALCTLAAPLALAAFYTGSRGGILATGAAVGMFIVSRFRINLRKLLLFGVLGFAALNLAPSYLTESKDSHGSAQGRVDMWAKGIEMVQSNPLFGIGKGNYARYTGRLVAHNSALEAMGETGFVGMFAWIAMIYLGFKGAAMLMRQGITAAERETTVAAVVSMGGYLVSSLFVSLETEIMYWLVGLLAGASRLGKEPVRFERRDFLIVGGIVVFYFIAFKLYIMRYY